MNNPLVLTQFAQDVFKGLSSSPKFLSSMYFYDDRGSEIFQDIMRMPEYYLTDCELEIFQNQKAHILKHFTYSSSSFELVELGAGDGLKTKILLSYFLKQGVDFEYAPIDISESAIIQLIDDLKHELPTLKTKALIGDYFHLLEELNQNDTKSKIVLFLGSNIGNFEEQEALSFLSKLRIGMKENDQLLIGFDLKKEASIILNAYNDPSGHTAAFNLNLLERMNRELGANFQIHQFEHKEVYSSESGAAKSYLTSLCDQKVYFQDLEIAFNFTKGESIYMEISQKYDEKMIHRIASQSGFKIENNFYDSKNYYLNSLWRLQS